MKLEKRIFIIGIPLLVIALISFIFWYVSFRVTYIDPSPVPLEAREITFYFSKKITKPYDTKNITIEPKINGTFTVGDSSVTFKPSQELPKGKFTVTFASITPENGSTTTLKSTTEVKYVPYNELSEAEKKRQIQESSSGQAEFPITDGTVPYAAVSWGVEYLLPVDSGNKDKLTLIVKIFADQGTGEPIVDYQARLEDARTEFVTYIESNGYKLTDYYIYYDNAYLSKYDQAAPNEL